MSEGAIDIAGLTAMNGDSRPFCDTNEGSLSENEVWIDGGSGGKAWRMDNIPNLAERHIAERPGIQIWTGFSAFSLYTVVQHSIRHLGIRW